MHVISRSRLREFATLHPEAEVPLDRWFRIAKRAEWTDFASVREDFAQADQVGSLTVFNIGGNKFRLVVRIKYGRGRVYVKGVFTHRDYDRGDW